jgi:hypothetical protein
MVATGHRDGSKEHDAPPETEDRQDSSSVSDGQDERREAGRLLDTLPTLPTCCNVRLSNHSARADSFGGKPFYLLRFRTRVQPYLAL